VVVMDGSDGDGGMEGGGGEEEEEEKEEEGGGEQTGEANHQLPPRLRPGKSKMTLVVLGPLTTVADALRIDQEAFSAVDEVFWMGGAVDVPGNILETWFANKNGQAEWNVFWDPPAAAYVWAHLPSSVRITMVPLDACNLAPVDEALLMTIASQMEHRASAFVGGCYALVGFREVCVCKVW
jgi:purine nucleosidase